MRHMLQSDTTLFIFSFNTLCCNIAKITFSWHMFLERALLVMSFITCLNHFAVFHGTGRNFVNFILAKGGIQFKRLYKHRYSWYLFFKLCLYISQFRFIFCTKKKHLCWARNSFYHQTWWHMPFSDKPLDYKLMFSGIILFLELTVDLLIYSTGMNSVIVPSDVTVRLIDVFNGQWAPLGCLHCNKIPWWTYILALIKETGRQVISSLSKRTPSLQ